LGRQTLTGFVNLSQVFQFLVKAGQRVRTFDGQIAAVIYFVPQFCNPLGQPRHPDRRRPEMNAALTLAIAQRHAQNGDGFSCAREIAA